MKPDDDSDTIRPDLPSHSEIELLDTRNFDSITNYAEKLSRETIKVVHELNNSIAVFDVIKYKLNPKAILSETTNLIYLFEDLKLKYIENAELFNKLIDLNKDNPGFLKVNDKMQMLKNLQITNDILNKCYDTIPNYNLKLSDLPSLNLETPTSPQLVASTSELRSLTSEVQDG